MKLCICIWAGRTTPKHFYEPKTCAEGVDPERFGEPIGYYFAAYDKWFYVGGRVPVEEEHHEIRWIDNGVMGRELTPNDATQLILADLRLKRDDATVGERASAWLTTFTNAVYQIIKEEEESER